MKRSYLIRTIAAAAAVWAGSHGASAGDIVTVSGEATYYDDGSKSRNECMRLAAEEARVDALAKKFGTIVSQDIMQSDRLVGKREQTDFLSLSQTSVRGEWIADDGVPEYDISYDKDRNFIIRCKVKGKAREITNNETQVEALVLRNGTDRRNADNLFRDGDDMFVLFRSAADGYLSIFLEDETRKVYLLLPYPTENRTRTPIVRNRDYVFFNRELDTLGLQAGNAVEEMTLTAPYNTEYNRLFVVFSPQPFSRPVMSSSEALPSMDSEEFGKWLVKARRNDPEMCVRAMNLQISPRNM